MIVDTAGLTTAQFAILVDRFHLTPEQIGRLTDWQIAKVYFHPRDKDGSIKIPIMIPEVVQDPMDVVEGMRWMFEPEVFERLKQEVAAKYGKASDQPGIGTAKDS